MRLSFSVTVTLALQCRLGCDVDTQGPNITCQPPPPCQVSSSVGLAWSARSYKLPTLGKPVVPFADLGADRKGRSQMTVVEPVSVSEIKNNPRNRAFTTTAQPTLTPRSVR